MKSLIIDVWRRNRMICEICMRHQVQPDPCASVESVRYVARYKMRDADNPCISVKSVCDI